jgi:hypothetical protein
MVMRVGPVYTGPMTARDIIDVLVGELQQMGQIDAPTLTEARNLLSRPQVTDQDTERCQDLVDRLQGMMQGAALPYCYFGVHPEQPGTLGYWPDWEVIEGLPVGTAREAKNHAIWMRTELGAFPFRIFDDMGTLRLEVE